MMIGQSRVVKCGDRGRRVKQIQHTLASLGYEVGSVDGRFGLVTEEAVQSFQRDFQLPPDGVVGHQTATLLRSGVQSKFLIHQVGASETLRGVAQSYGLSTRAIAQINNLSDLRVTPGQTLRIPKRKIVGYCTSDAQPTESLFRHADRLDVVVTAGLALTPQDGVEGVPHLREDLQAWVRARKIELWLAIGLPSELAQLEQTLFYRKRLVKSLHELANKVRELGADGVVIVIPPSILARHRFALNRLCKSLRSILPNTPIAVTLPLQAAGRSDLLDYRSIAKWCRWVLLYPEPNLDELMHTIRQVLREVPCWQVLVGLVPSPANRPLKRTISLITKYNLGGSVIFDFGRDTASFWASLYEEFLSGDINPNPSS